jgi:Protein of unknown function (DUF1376)
VKWYKHDPAAFLEGAIGLNAEERGFYITIIDLLCARDGIGVTDELVYKAIGCNPRTWQSIKERLARKGKIWTLEDGTLMAKRVEYVLNEARMHAERQSKRARNRWEKDAAVNKINDLQMPLANMPTTTTTTKENTKRKSEAKTNGNGSGETLAAKAPPEFEFEQEQAVPSLAELADQEFERWWKLYPRKIGKRKAREAYAKARKKVLEQILIGGAKQASTQFAETDPKFIPHPATWLNGERWTDEQNQQPGKKMVRCSDGVMREIDLSEGLN